MAEPRALSCADVQALAAGFVLGSLGADEMSAVRAHLATCTAPHPELATLGAVVPALALAAPEAQPRPELVARILAAARAEAAENTTAAVAVAAARGAAASGAPTVGLAPAATAAPVVPGQQSSTERPTASPAWLSRVSRPAWGFVALAAVVVIGLIGWNLQLQGQVSDLNAYRVGVDAVMSAAASPGGRLAVLGAATAGGPTGIAALTAEDRVVVAMRSLAPTSGAQVYEAWLIAGSSAPLPVGSLVVGSGGTGTLQASTPSVSTGGSVVIALTREPGPGATTPTLPILAKGSTTAAVSPG